VALVRSATVPEGQTIIFGCLSAHLDQCSMDLVMMLFWEVGGERGRTSF
jgi:hypothetical protein